VVRRPNKLQKFFEGIKKKKRINKAIVAIARKMFVIVYWMLLNK
jgi:hypothetical protein